VKHRAPVVITPYSDTRPRQFQEEAALLASRLPAHVVIEHVGSTAALNMPAKPIVDMMLGARSLDEIARLLADLAALGYQCMPHDEAAIPGRRFFAKPLTRPRRFHLHGVVRGERF